MTMTVRDNPEKHRYEVYADEQLAGFSEYRLGSDEMAFTHTEIGEGFSGRGLAVLPFCPYVRRVIADNPDKYLDLVPAKARAKFKLPLAGDTDHADHDSGGRKDHR